MNDKENRENADVGRSGAGTLHKRRATLEDGRYLIYYTFGEKAGAGAGAGDEAKLEPEAVPEAAEERRV